MISAPLAHRAIIRQIARPALMSSMVIGALLVGTTFATGSAFAAESTTTTTPPTTTPPTTWPGTIVDTDSLRTTTTAVPRATAPGATPTRPGESGPSTTLIEIQTPGNSDGASATQVATTRSSGPKSGKTKTKNPTTKPSPKPSAAKSSAAKSTTSTTTTIPPTGAAPATDASSPPTTKTPKNTKPTAKAVAAGATPEATVPPDASGFDSTITTMLPPDQVPGADIPAATWLALRQCESHNNYAINTGNGYYGAYQFAVGTWRKLGYAGYPHRAAPAVQDEAARRLQALLGWGQWPACSKKIGVR